MIGWKEVYIIHSLPLFAASNCLIWKCFMNSIGDLTSTVRRAAWRCLNLVSSPPSSWALVEPSAQERYPPDDNRKEQSIKVIIKNTYDVKPTECVLIPIYVCELAVVLQIPFIDKSDEIKNHLKVKLLDLTEEWLLFLTYWKIWKLIPKLLFISFESGWRRKTLKLNSVNDVLFVYILKLWSKSYLLA